jgi:hypothetical protein
VKKQEEKEGRSGRWRTAEDKLARLMQTQAGTGTEGLTEEELATVSARRFDRADTQTRMGLIELARRLRSPLTAGRLVAKANAQLALELLAALAELGELVEDAPPWLAEAPGVNRAVKDLAAALGEGRSVEIDREGERLAALPETLRASALRSLVKSAGEAVVPLAREVARKGEAFAAEVAEALSEVPSESVAALFLELLSGTENKALAKSLRRAIQRLRQGGIRVDLPAEGAPVFKPIERARPEAYVTGIDGQGARLVFLVQPRVPHGLTLFEALVSDARGLLEFNAYETHRRGVDKFIGSLESRPGLLLTSTTPSHARYLVGTSLEKNVKSGTRVPSGVSELRPYWDAGEDAPAPPPDAVLAALGPDDGGEALASSAQLLEEEAFKGWYVDPDLVKPSVDRTREAARSKIVLNPLQKQERQAGLIRAATDEIFSSSGAGSIREQYAQRLLEMAIVLALRGNARAAKQAKAVADRLGDPESRPSLSPFAYALLEKTVTLLTKDEEEQEKKTKEEEGPTLIVKP